MGVKVDRDTLQEEVKNAVRKRFIELHRQREFFKQLYEKTGEEIYLKQVMMLEEKLKWLKVYL
jgi:hypothetical protein